LAHLDTLKMYVSPTQQLLRHIIRIFIGEIDGLYAGVYQRLSAHAAGLMGDIDLSTLSTNTEHGSLDNAILLGVYAPA